jgi:hypothetical protein
VQEQIGPNPQRPSSCESANVGAAHCCLLGAGAVGSVTGTSALNPGCRRSSGRVQLASPPCAAVGTMPRSVRSIGQKFAWESCATPWATASVQLLEARTTNTSATAIFKTFTPRQFRRRVSNDCHKKRRAMTRSCSLGSSSAGLLIHRRRRARLVSAAIALQESV